MYRKTNKIQWTLHKYVQKNKQNTMNSFKIYVKTLTNVIQKPPTGAVAWWNKESITAPLENIVQVDAWSYTINNFFSFIPQRCRKLSIAISQSLSTLQGYWVDRIQSSLIHQWLQQAKELNIKNTTVRGNKKDPRKQIIIFGIVQYFFTKFSEIILDTICHYCCKFYRLIFRCLEVAQFWI